MAEQWSSKSYAWVRILLSLRFILISKKPRPFLNNDRTTNKNIKYKRNLLTLAKFGKIPLRALLAPLARSQRPRVVPTPAEGAPRILRFAQLSVFKTPARTASAATSTALWSNLLLALTNNSRSTANLVFSVPTNLFSLILLFFNFFFFSNFSQQFLFHSFALTVAPIYGVNARRPRRTSAQNSTTLTYPLLIKNDTFALKQFLLALSAQERPFRPTAHLTIRRKSLFTGTAAPSSPLRAVKFATKPRPPILCPPRIAAERGRLLPCRSLALTPAPALKRLLKSTYRAHPGCARPLLAPLQFFLVSSAARIRTLKTHVRRQTLLDLFTPRPFEFSDDAIIRVTRSSLNYNLNRVRRARHTGRFLDDYYSLSYRNLRNFTPAALPLLGASAHFAQLINFFENAYNPLFAQVGFSRLRKAPFTPANFPLLSALNLFNQPTAGPRYSTTRPYAESTERLALAANYVRQPLLRGVLGNNAPAPVAGVMPLFATTRIEILSAFLLKPFLFKLTYLFFSFTNKANLNFFYERHAAFYKQIFPFVRRPNIQFNNLFYEKNFLFFLRKNTVKSFAFFKLPLLVFSWHYLTLIKFLEYATGKRIYLKFYSLLSVDLEFAENARCALWSYRLRSFKRAFGAKLFLVESLKIIYTALKYKDIYFLSNWLLKFFYKISFWKYKMIFRYLYYVLRYLFRPHLREMNVHGLKFQLKGKVSVAGNARTRTIRNRVGDLSHSTFTNKIILDLNLIRTFTGVIGFKTWLSF